MFSSNTLSIINRTIIAMFLVVPFKWVPPINDMGAGFIDTRIVIWGGVFGLFMIWVLRR